jgi:hypothetical protein
MRANNSAVNAADPHIVERTVNGPAANSRALFSRYKPRKIPHNPHVSEAPQMIRHVVVAILNFRLIMVKGRPK